MLEEGREKRQKHGGSSYPFHSSTCRSPARKGLVEFERLVALYLGDPSGIFLLRFRQRLTIKELLAPQSGALRISAYGDFQSQSQSQPNPSTYSFRAVKPFYGDLDCASRPWQINVDQCRPKQVSILRNFTTFKKFQNFQNFQNFQIFQNF